MCTNLCIIYALSARQHTDLNCIWLHSLQGRRINVNASQLTDLGIFCSHITGPVPEEFNGWLPRLPAQMVINAERDCIFMKSLSIMRDNTMNI